MNIEYPTPRQEYKVLVRCFTYNHSKYIEDTLEGFAKQQTNFPFVCLIMDDASTDFEQDVIKKWMECKCDMTKAEIIDIPSSEIIIVPHRTNIYCTYAFYLLKYNLYNSIELKIDHIYPWRKKCIYEAMCEGDDYWTDSLKLQKECDYLDNHPDKTLVYTDCNVLFEDQGKIINDAIKTGYFKQTDNYRDFLLEGKYITPCSWVYRLPEYEEIIVPPFTTDITLCIAFELLMRNEVGYINETTCTYRIVHSGASHNTDLSKRYNYLKGVFNTEKYFLEKYSNHFTREDIRCLYNKRYINHIPLAVALNDTKMLKEIRRFGIDKPELKYRLMLLFSSIPLARKYVYNKLVQSYQKGL